MILEIADIRIQPGQQAAFEEAIGRAAGSVISQAAGMLGWTVSRGLESPERYILQVVWATLVTTPWASAKGPCLRSGAPSSGPSLRSRRRWSTSRWSASRAEPARP